MPKNKPPRKPKNATRRSREYLTETEVERVISAAKRTSRHGHRNATMILMAYRHGLRVSELVTLDWQQVDLEQIQLHVQRRKKGVPSIHPLYGPEIRALRKLARDYPGGRYVFVSQWGHSMTPSNVRKMVAKAGVEAHIGMPIHPHMLRHSTGFKLANEGRDTRSIQLYLGHRNIQHTVIYTHLSMDRFKDFWVD